MLSSTNISKLPDYYKNLAKECESKQDYSCCMSSVNRMANGNYQLAPETACPEGYQSNMLKCIDSFKWCEPKGSQQGHNPAGDKCQIDSDCICTLKCPDCCGEVGQSWKCINNKCELGFYNE